MSKQELTEQEMTKQNSESLRLDRILANAGIDTRSKVKKLLRQGCVEVDGVVEKDGGIKLVPCEHVIRADGVLINYAQFVYLVMNKPEGCISATEDERHKTVIDLLDTQYLHFEPFPVGRLDIDTTGLLLITNDGQFAHELMSPNKHIAKVYRATLESPAKASYVTQFEKGVMLKNGYRCLPAKIAIDEKAPTTVDITVVEGKFHQIKKMIEAMDNKVLKLDRIALGGLMLEETGLDRGQSRELTDAEMSILR